MRYVETFLIALSLVLFLWTPHTKAAMVSFASALALSIADRTSTSRRLEQKIVDKTKLLNSSDTSVQILEEKVSTLYKDKDDFITLYQDSAQQWTDLIQAIRPYTYELIDTDKSHKLLFKALNESQEKLILVSPWLSENIIDDKFISLLRKTLEQSELKIHFGFGHWQDTNKIWQAERATLSIDAFLNLVEENDNLKRKGSNQKPWKYTAVTKLRNLQAHFKDQLSLQLIGTHQKYLVCDHKFALITSHNFLSAKPGKDDLELGIRTDDPIIINKLIKEFEQSRNLEVQR